MRLDMVSVFFLVFLSRVSAPGQGVQTRTWSSSGCDTCSSTIVDSTWYPDGSPLIAEAVTSDHTDAVVAVSVRDGNFVVAVGFDLERDPSVTISPRNSITLESDSSPRMVLYSLSDHSPNVPNGDLYCKKHLGDSPVTLRPSAPVSGCLFFPVDRDASHITVVVAIGSETFRFPFARDPNAHAKFNDPAKFSSQSTEQQPGASSSDENSKSSPVAEKSVGASNAVTSPPSIDGLAIAPGQAGGCSRNISFAVAEDGQLESRVPRFAQKWIVKNRKKYPALCFSQTPSPHAPNYLLLFSTSQSAFNGIYPTVRTSTSAGSAPVSGTGAVTDNYGGMWNYTYNGTVTTTTTTTSQVNLPYTDTTTALYVYSYDQHGQLLSRHRRAMTTRQGGDGANTLGYNLGAALGSIHLKERLLKDAVDDVAR